MMPCMTHLKKMNEATRPVLLVGGGALNSDAGAELVELAAKADTYPS